MNVIQAGAIKYSYGAALSSSSKKATGIAILRHFGVSTKLNDKESCQVLIVGSGAGGCALAAKLSSKLGVNKVTVLDPADRHYYQPMFTLIGAGMKRLDQSYYLMSEVMPMRVKWVKEKAIEFCPQNNYVATSTGRIIKYDMLLIATGLQLFYEKIPGLIEALSIRDGKVCSIYSPEYVERTYTALKNIKSGNAVFTFPNSPVKCPGAPQKIVYISEHYFRKTNKRDKINIIYNTSLPVLFGVKHYADALWKIVKKRNIEVNTRRNLVEIRPDEDIAIFQDLENPQQLCAQEYSMLHVVPPMGTPPELSKCKDLVNEAGFVTVDKFTMQHLKYKNIFAIGDCADSPNSKTTAAAAAQSPVVFQNMMAVLNGKSLPDAYDGYASCPLVTGYHTCMLAEFDYSLTPLETFPVAQNKERYSMFIMKKYFMPILYWKLMLNGYWNGPALMRNIFCGLKWKSK